MSAKERAVLGGLLLLLAGALIPCVTRYNDPIYGGKRLSQHLEALSAQGIALGAVHGNPGEEGVLTLPGIVRPRCSDESARKALNKVGTNALPMLAGMLRSKNTRFRRWLWNTLEARPFLQRVIRIEPPNDDFARKIQALAAFHELGSRAAPAVPKIIPLLDNPDTAIEAISALLCIRPQRESEVLSLTNVLGIRRTSLAGSSPSHLHASALLALSAFGPEAKGARPILMDCLRTSTNGRVRAAACIGLARIGAPADEVIPFILAEIPKTNPSQLAGFIAPTPAAIAQATQRMEDYQTLLMNIFAASEYGYKAAIALPVLSNLQSYPLRNVQEAARVAAAKIKASPVSPSP